MKLQPGEQLYHIFQLHCERTVSVCSALPSLLRLPVTLLVNTCYLMSWRDTWVSWVRVTGRAIRLAHNPTKLMYPVPQHLIWSAVTPTVITWVFFRYHEVTAFHSPCSGCILLEPKQQDSGMWACTAQDIGWKAPYNFALELKEYRRL